MESKQNKAVYVRGPDDVFRRKDPGGDVTKKQVDTFINELMECGFKVAPDEPPIETPKNQDLSALMNPKKPPLAGSSFPSESLKRHSKLPPTPALRTLSRINTDLSPSTTLTRSASPLHSFVSASAEHELDCASETWTARSSTAPSPRLGPGMASVQAPILGSAPTSAEKITLNSKNMASFIAVMPKIDPVSSEKIKAWAGPFLGGMCTTYALQKMQPLFLYYGIIAAYILKVFVVWLLFTGTVCWYFGVLSFPAGLEYIEKFQWILNMFPSTVRQNPVSEKLHHLSGNIDTFKSPVSAISVHHLTVERKPPLPDNKPSKVPELPAPVVNVTPFVAPKRHAIRRTQTDIPSSGPFCPTQGHDHGDMSSRMFGIPKHFRISKSSSPTHPFVNLSDRRHSSSSLPIDGNRDARDKPRGSTVPMAHVAQPDTNTELPFICEMKLKPRADSVDHNATKLGEKPDLRRSGTSMSQKSVLGTRANYSKFLANFDE